MAGIGTPFTSSSEQFWPARVSDRLPVDFASSGGRRRDPSPVPVSAAGGVVGVGGGSQGTKLPSGGLFGPAGPMLEQRQAFGEPGGGVVGGSGTDFGGDALFAGRHATAEAYIRQLSNSSSNKYPTGRLPPPTLTQQQQQQQQLQAAAARGIPGLMLQAGKRPISADPTEFPMLGKPSAAGLSARINFVSAANKSVMSANEEFSIQQEDFPALPGATAVSGADVELLPTSATTDATGNGQQHQQQTQQQQLGGSRSTVVYHQGGTVTGVPSSMVRDQYGMIGLLSLIKVGEDSPNLSLIAPGIDLNTLGLPLNNVAEIYSCLGSPWTDPCLAKPQYVDYPVPQEYLVGSQIKDKLPPPPLDQLQVETLFWLFYNCTSDQLQLSAAKELHRRDWRWIKSEKLWVTRSGHGHEKLASQAGPQGERGHYYYWDTKSWSRQHKSFTIYYDQIDNAPSNYPDPHVGSGTMSAGFASQAS